MHRQPPSHRLPIYFRPLKHQAHIGNHPVATASQPRDERHEWHLRRKATTDDLQRHVDDLPALVAAKFENETAISNLAEKQRHE